MRKEELMVGDWVNFNGTIDKVQEILYVEGKGYCASFAVSATLFPIPLDKITPIPLTTEILEKNGYTHDELTEESIKNLHSVIDIAYLISDDHRIIVHNDMCLNSNNKWYVHIDSEDFCTIATSEITYVHQLQHLLNDNNIEKKIIL